MAVARERRSLYQGGRRPSDALRAALVGVLAIVRMAPVREWPYQEDRHTDGYMG